MIASSTSTKQRITDLNDGIEEACSWLCVLVRGEHTGSIKLQMQVIEKMGKEYRKLRGLDNQLES